MKFDACPVLPPGLGSGPLSSRTMSVQPSHERCPTRQLPTIPAPMTTACARGGRSVTAGFPTTGARPRPRRGVDRPGDPRWAFLYAPAPHGGPTGVPVDAEAALATGGRTRARRRLRLPAPLPRPRRPPAAVRTVVQHGGRDGVLPAERLRDLPVVGRRVRLVQRADLRTEARGPDPPALPRRARARVRRRLRRPQRCAGELRHPRPQPPVHRRVELDP